MLYAGYRSRWHLDLGPESSLEECWELVPLGGPEMGPQIKTPQAKSSHELPQDRSVGIPWRG